MGELTVEDLENADEKDVLFLFEWTLFLKQRTDPNWLWEQPAVQQAHAQAIKQVEKKAREKGIEEAQQILMKSIIRTLTIRFEETPPTEWTERLQNKPLEQLETLNEIALTINELNEFESHL